MLVAEVIGNLGFDAVIKDFNGKKYVSMSVAHSVFSKDQAGNRQESTVWVSVLWYGEGGGIFPYLKKGAKVFVRGRENVKLYQDRQGSPQIAINLDATEVILCGSKPEATQGTQDHSMSQQPVVSAPPLSSSPFGETPEDDLPY